MADLEEALDLLKTAAELMGIETRSLEAQQATAARVHAVVPGVPLHHALAVVKAMESMGWKSPVSVKADQAKLAAVRDLAGQLGDRTNEPAPPAPEVKVHLPVSDRRIVEPIRRMLLEILDGPT